MIVRCVLNGQEFDLDNVAYQAWRSSQTSVESNQWQQALAHINVVKNYCNNQHPLWASIVKTSNICNKHILFEQGNTFLGSESYLNAAEKFAAALAYAEGEEKNVIKKCQAVAYHNHAVGLLNNGSDNALSDALSYLSKCSSLSNHLDASCRDIRKKIECAQLQKQANKLLLQDKYQDAIACYNKMIDKTGDYKLITVIKNKINELQGVISYKKGIEYFNNNNHADAAHAFDRACSLFPSGSQYKDTNGNLLKDRSKTFFDNSNALVILEEADKLAKDDNSKSAADKYISASKLFKNKWHSKVAEENAGIMQYKIHEKIFVEYLKEGKYSEAKKQLVLGRKYLPKHLVKDIAGIDNQIKTLELLESVFKARELSKAGDKEQANDLYEDALKSGVEQQLSIKGTVYENYISVRHDILREKSSTHEEKGEYHEAIKNLYRLISIHDGRIGTGVISDLLLFLTLQKCSTLDRKLAVQKVTELLHEDVFAATEMAYELRALGYNDPALSSDMSSPEEILSLPDDSLSDEAKISKLNWLFNLAQQKIEKTKDTDVSLIMGNTKSGKSTLVNFMIGNELVIIKNKFKIGLEVAKDAIGPVIGSKSVSETTVPNIYYSDEYGIICDCPGFSDNRGMIQDIANGFYITYLLQQVNSVRIFLVSDFSDISRDNIQSFCEMIKTFDDMLADSSLMSEMMESGSIILVVNKVDKSISYEEVKSYYYEKFLHETIKKSDNSNSLLTYFLETPGKMCTLPRISSDDDPNGLFIHSLVDAYGEFFAPKERLSITPGISYNSRHFLEKYLKSSCLTKQMQSIFECLELMLDNIDLNLSLLTQEKLGHYKCNLTDKLSELRAIEDKTHSCSNISSLVDVIKCDIASIIGISGSMAIVAQDSIDFGFQTNCIKQKARSADIIMSRFGYKDIDGFGVTKVIQGFLHKVNISYINFQEEVLNRLNELTDMSKSREHKLLTETLKADSQRTADQIKYNIWHVYKIKFDNPMLNDEMLHKTLAKDKFCMLLDITSKLEYDETTSLLDIISGQDIQKSVDLILDLGVDDVQDLLCAGDPHDIFASMMNYGV